MPDRSRAIGGGETLSRSETLNGFRPWREFVTTRFPWLEVDGGCRQFRAHVRYRDLGAGSLAALSSGACRVTRTMRGVDRADAGFLKILWQRGGSMAVEQDGRRCRLEAGMAAICDTSRPYQLRLANGAELAVLTLPHEAVPGWERLSQNVCGTALGDRTVLAAALAALLLVLDQGPDEADDGADRILPAVQLMLSASLHQSALARRPAATPLKLDLARHHIVSHIDDPDLGPDELATALHVSRRTLYASFKALDLTPSRFIRDIRLRSVRDALADRHNARHRIRDIALDHGFDDPASFCRTFKAAFGISPSTWRARAHADG